jgi:hypothetical protein
MTEVEGDGVGILIERQKAGTMARVPTAAGEVAGAPEVESLRPSRQSRS